jgi:hypothetical protein
MMVMGEIEAKRKEIKTEMIKDFLLKCIRVIFYLIIFTNGICIKLEALSFVYSRRTW